MNARNITAVLALVSAAAFAAPAAAVTSSGSVLQDVQSAVSGSGNITVQVSGSTVTLYGYSETTDSLAAERAARAAPGVERVINNIDGFNS